MWVNAILVFGAIVSLHATDNKQQSGLLDVFDDQTRPPIEQVYKAAPGSLIVFLMKRDIARPITFRSSFGAKGVGMGTDAATVTHKFNQYLRESLETKFEAEKITEIRAEELSLDITNKYKDKLFHRPNPGEKVSSIFQFENTYRGKAGGEWMTAVYAYVYMEITEICENNFIMANERRFDYHLKIEINGLSVKRDKVIQLGEIIKRDGLSKAIATVQKQAALSWDEL